VLEPDLERGRRFIAANSAAFDESPLPEEPTNAQESDAWLVAARRAGI
jgi:hypothetical protein